MLISRAVVVMNVVASDAGAERIDDLEDIPAVYHSVTCVDQRTDAFGKLVKELNVVLLTV